MCGSVMLMLLLLHASAVPDTAMAQCDHRAPYDYDYYGSAGDVTEYDYCLDEQQDNNQASPSLLTNRFAILYVISMFVGTVYLYRLDLISHSSRPKVRQQSAIATTKRLRLHMTHAKAHR